MELFLFGRTVQGCSRASAAGDDLCNVVKVAGANFPLMSGCGVTRGLDGKLGFLQFRIRRHPTFLISTGEIKHAVIQGMEAREGNELTLVTHRPELALTLGERRAIKLLLPVK